MCGVFWAEYICDPHWKGDMQSSEPRREDVPVSTWCSLIVKEFFVSLSLLESPVKSVPSALACSNFLGPRASVWDRFHCLPNPAHLPTVVFPKRSLYFLPKLAIWELCPAGHHLLLEYVRIPFFWLHTQTSTIFLVFYKICLGVLLFSLIFFLEHDNTNLFNYLHSPPPHTLWNQLNLFLSSYWLLLVFHLLLSSGTSILPMCVSIFSLWFCHYLDIAFPLPFGHFPLHFGKSNHLSSTLWFNFLH